jgi:hypothetical protein
LITKESIKFLLKKAMNLVHKLMERKAKKRYVRKKAKKKVV